jgi:hypothetical protein
MPRGDGTGPMGIGPMTGRGHGACAGFASGYANNWCGMGRGRGFRRMYRMTGMPVRARYGPEPDEDNENEDSALDERKTLQNQAAFLEKQLSRVRKRLNSLEDKE